MSCYPDFGTSRVEALQSIVNARRLPRESLSMWQKATHLFKSDGLVHLLNNSLSTIRLRGFIPQDFIEQHIAFDQLKYSMDDLVDFGFTFEHFLALHIQPHHFKQFEWRHYQQLHVTAEQMMKTCLTIHDLVALHLEPQQLHQLGWTWDHITSIGGNKTNILISPQDISIYFNTPQTQQKERSVSQFKF